MLSYYAANKILQAITGKGSSSSSYGATGSVVIASRAYLALSSTEPNASGGGVTEPSTSVGYQRKLIGNAIAGEYGSLLADPVDGTITNNQEIHFNEATSAWGTQSYVCIYDAETGGNLIAWGTLSTSISPTANTVPVIKTSGFVISVD